MAGRFAISRVSLVNCMLRHIKRLHAACTLKRAAILSRFAPITVDFDRLCECLSLDAFTLQCHMPYGQDQTCMNPIKTVCVYCGSGPGTNPHFVEAAIALGKTLAENGVSLVFGGGSLGLLGPVAI